MNSHNIVCGGIVSHDCSGNYAATIETIMSFLALPVSEEVATSLVNSMKFYDISTSYFYRLGESARVHS